MIVCFFYLRFEQWIKFNPRADGNCMFSALATDSNMEAQLLRLSIVGFLKNTRFLGQSSCDWQNSLVTEYDGTREQYLARMRQDGTWGDMITLQAYSQMSNTQVIVLSDQNPATLITPDDRDTNNDPNRRNRNIDLERPLVILGHYAELHYVLLNKENEECLKAALDALKRFG